MQERLRAILDKIVQWWKKFNNKQRMLMISSVGVVIIALVILGVVMSKPKMVELVASDDAKQASEIKSLLSDNNITYQVGDDLVFYVDKDDEVNAIMLLGETISRPKAMILIMLRMEAFLQQKQINKKNTDYTLNLNLKNILSSLIM